MKEPRITRGSFDIYVDGFDESTRLEIDVESEEAQNYFYDSEYLTFVEVEAIYNYMKRRVRKCNQ